MSESEEPVLVTNKTGAFSLWLIVFLLVAASLGLPALRIIRANHYPDLNYSLLSCFVSSCLLGPTLWQLAKLTISIKLYSKFFTVKTAGQSEKKYAYSEIIYYHERQKKQRGQTWMEFLFALNDGTYYIISSTDFKSYDQIVTQLGLHGTNQLFDLATPWSDKYIRYSILWLTTVGIACILFGFLAHDEVSPHKAALVSVDDIIADVKVNHSRGNFHGVTIYLTDHATFHFYAEQKIFSGDLKHKAKSLHRYQRISLLIRESDFRKKIVRSAALSFGDKYCDYEEILVFGLDRIKVETPVYEESHTQPWLRTGIIGLVLLVLWAFALSSDESE